MISQQKSVDTIDLNNGIKQRATSQRLLSSLLMGIGVVLILTLLEVCLLLLFNPFHILGDTANRSIAILSLLAHAQAITLIPLAEFLIATLLAFLAIRPLALIAYLREVHEAQADYSQLYTPLKALTNIRRTTEAYTANVTAPTVIVQDEQISILNLVREQDTHLLILGLPGAGKTMALRVYQYEAAQNPVKLVLQRGRIPIYVPMKNYSLYLKDHEQPLAADDEDSNKTTHVTMLDFLYEGDLPGLRHLRNYLLQLSHRGQLLLLCDGLNEVDNNYIGRISAELVQWMRDTPNRLVMTCREVDYREQHEFEQLVDEGQRVRRTLHRTPEQTLEAHRRSDPAGN